MDYISTELIILFFVVKVMKCISATLTLFIFICSLICKFYTFIRIFYNFICKIFSSICKIYTFNWKSTLRFKILKNLDFKMYILHLLISHKCKFYTSKCKLNTFII